MQKVIIVGDKFAAFACQKAVVCVSELELRLERGECLDHELFELGQGLAPHQIDNLVKLAGACGRREQLLFGPVTKCGSELVHKRRPENSLLSLPVKTDDRTFEAELLLDDRCDLLIDHLGGQHIPGMVLVEAVRQMGLAVLESYFVKEFPHGCAFLWTSMKMNFTEFAFPVKTIVTTSVREHRVIKIRREAFLLDLQCIQRGHVVASCEVTAEVRDRRLVERLENGLAAAASVGTAAVLSPMQAEWR